MRHAYEHITDEQIRTAELFDGWDWWFWAEIKLDRARLDKPEHHAYHIRYLAGVMLTGLKWVGPPPVVDGDRYVDGSHRIRAVEFLQPLVTIEIPKQERD